MAKGYCNNCYTEIEPDKQYCSEDCEREYKQMMKQQSDFEED